MFYNPKVKLLGIENWFSSADILKKRLAPSYAPAFLHMFRVGFDNFSPKLMTSNRFEFLDTDPAVI